MSGSDPKVIAYNALEALPKDPALKVIKIVDARRRLVRAEQARATAVIRLSEDFPEVQTATGIKKLLAEKELLETARSVDESFRSLLGSCSVPKVTLNKQGEIDEDSDIRLAPNGNVVVVVRSINRAIVETDEKTRAPILELIGGPLGPWLPTVKSDLRARVQEVQDNFNQQSKLPNFFFRPKKLSEAKIARVHAFADVLSKDEKLASYRQEIEGILEKETWSTRFETFEKHEIDFKALIFSDLEISETRPYLEEVRPALDDYFAHRGAEPAAELGINITDSVLAVSKLVEVSTEKAPSQTLPGLAR